MFRPLRILAYRRFFCAQVIALLGTGLATVALGLLTQKIAPATAQGALGTIFAIKMIAYVLIGPITSAALHRFSPRQIMIGSDLLRLTAAALLPFVDSVWQIYLLVFTMQSASATFTPTFQAVIPDILPDEDDYTAALSLSRLAYDLEAVLSPSLAAGLLLIVAPSMLFVGTSLSFGASALLIAATTLCPQPSESPSREHILHRTVRGFAIVVRNAALRPIMALNLPIAAAGAYVLVETVSIVKTDMQLGDHHVARLLAANGLGSIIVALALPRILRKLPERFTMITGATILTGTMLAVPWCLSLINPSMKLVILATLWWLVGVGWSATATPIGRLIRRHTPAESLSDVFAAQFSLSHACWLLAYPLLGWLGVINLVWAAFAAAALAGIGVGAGVLLWPSSTISVPG